MSSMTLPRPRRIPLQQHTQGKSPACTVELAWAGKQQCRPPCPLPRSPGRAPGARSCCCDRSCIPAPRSTGLFPALAGLSPIPMLPQLNHRGAPRTCGSRGAAPLPTVPCWGAVGGPGQS